MPYAPPAGQQVAEVLTLDRAKLVAIAPNGYVVPDMPTRVQLLFDQTVQWTADEKGLVLKTVQDEMQKQYEAIKKKQDAYLASNGQDPRYPAPSYADLMELLQAGPRGVVKAGVKGVQMRIDGALARYILDEGLHARLCLLNRWRVVVPLTSHARPRPFRP
ncbi:MAG: hypothetical protein K2X82_26150, partial [Gemmataceae bacterium]|nr:hypothetical protein [Gemmataceae bacterium]